MKVPVVFICVVLLTGCIFQGDKILFETVAKGESTYPGSDPLLVVATSYEDIIEVIQYTGYEEDLKALDYQEYVVICVFLGMDTILYDIEIQELIREQEALVILTTFFEPDKDVPVAQQFESPFHIIQVKKSEIKLKGDVSFLLQDTKGFLHVKVVVSLE